MTPAFEYLAPHDRRKLFLPVKSFSANLVRNDLPEKAQPVAVEGEDQAKLIQRMLQEEEKARRASHGQKAKRAKRIRVDCPREFRVVRIEAIERDTTKMSGEANEDVFWVFIRHNF